MGYIAQSLIIFAVVAANIHWKLTPNPVVPAIIGIAIAWALTRIWWAIKVRRERVD